MPIYSYEVKNMIILREHRRLKTIISFEYKRPPIMHESDGLEQHNINGSVMPI